MSATQFNTQLSNEQVNVSAEALVQLSAILDSEEDAEGVRIFVSGGGCGGMTYGMTLVEKPTEYDCALERDGLNIYVDAIALGFLEGVEIDYKTEGMRSSFVFKNVFANTDGAGTCGTCGSAGGGGCG